MTAILVISGLVAALTWLTSRSVVGAALSAVLCAGAGWLLLLPIAFGHASTWWFLALTCAVLVQTLRSPPRRAGPADRSPDAVQRELVRFAASAAIVGIPAALVVLFSTWSALHAPRYRELLTVHERDFDTQQVLLDQSQARFVDQALAVRAAEELLGNELGVGSRASIGGMTVQSIGGRLWWVAPLEHKDALKWLSNGNTSGFVMVSAADYSDARIVDGFALRYGMGGWLNDWLPRHLYLSGVTDVALTDFTFELDDDGRPWWVVTLISPAVGFDGFIPTGVAVVNPETGAFERYGVADAPAWIDRIQPKDLTAERLSDWGMFVHGWWNSWVSGQDVIQASEGMSLVYTVDGRSAWYTGMQSTGSSDQGTMGFVLVDTRTGEASFYRRAGITEAAAKEVLEGQVQDKEYVATWPVPYLVQGVPTFLCVLKDQSGNAQMVGLVAYNDRTVVAVGDSAREALRAYASRLRGRDNHEALSGASTGQTWRGLVERAVTEQIRDETVLYLLLDSSPTQAFSVPAHLGPEVLLTRAGDRVTITAQPTEGPLLDVLRFDNDDLGLLPTGEPSRRPDDGGRPTRTSP